MSLIDPGHHIKGQNILSMFFRKQLVLLLCIALACLIGGLYGILHDQLTYTISSEYYTKFKFYQFGLKHTGDEAIFPHPRVQVSVVGFMATWWMGLPIGLILGLVGLVHKDHKQMLRATFKAMLVTLLVAFIAGLFGLIYGKFWITDTKLNWDFPKNLIDVKNFIAVGSMHNHSYLGGILGLFIGAIYSIRQRQKD